VCYSRQLNIYITRRGEAIAVGGVYVSVGGRAQVEKAGRVRFGKNEEMAR